MIPLSDRPLISRLEEVAISELDRQYLNEEIQPSSTGEAFFDAIDGEVVGVPDWWALVAAIVSGLWEEEGR